MILKLGQVTFDTSANPSVSGSPTILQESVVCSSLTCYQSRTCQLDIAVRFTTFPPVNRGTCDCFVGPLSWHPVEERRSIEKAPSKFRAEGRRSREPAHITTYPARGLHPSRER